MLIPHMKLFLEKNMVLYLLHPERTLINKQGFFYYKNIVTCLANQNFVQIH